MVHPFQIVLARLMAATDVLLVILDITDQEVQVIVYLLYYHQIITILLRHVTGIDMSMLPVIGENTHFSTQQ